MTAHKENQSSRKHGGGHPSAVFFWPVWLLGLAITAWLGGVLLRPQDKLLASVPRAAFAYVHGNGDALPNGMIFDVPAALRPDETGVFWIYRDETAAERSILLRWKFGPRQDERAVLQKLGAISVDGHAFAFVPSEAAAQDIQRARWGGANLESNGSIRRSLTYVRALMPVQAYLDPVAVLNAPEPLADFLKKSEPTVIGLNVAEEIRAFALPMKSAAAQSVLLAKLPAPDGRKPAKSPTMPAAPLELRLPAGTIDPLTFVADMLNRGQNLARLIRLPQETLRAALRGSFHAALSVNDGAVGAYTAYFTGTTIEKLTDKISGQLSMTYPSKRQNTLPDGTDFTELIADRTKFQFLKLPDGRLKLNVPEADTAIFIQADEQGVTISNLPDASKNQDLSVNKTIWNSACRSLADNFDAPYLKTELLGGRMNLTTWLPQISSVEVVEIVDNFIYLCGYTEGNVDKSVD